MKLTELHFKNAEMLLHKYENFLHHIAEEELIACKVHEMKAIDEDTIAFICDCNDEPRQPGYQKDLSEKVKARLVLHADLAFVDPRVYHKDIDPR